MNEGNVEGEVRRAFRGHQSLIKLLSSRIKVNFIGTDFSLSPWGERSVAKLIERVIDGKIGSSGTLNAIKRLNGLIKECSVNLRLTGYNEVMLSLGEDEGLKRAVRAGYIKVRDLVSYSSVCAIGLDMVPIPLRCDEKKLKSLILDVAAVSAVKRRPMALRLILVDKDPREEVKLPWFGSCPVMKIE